MHSPKMTTALLVGAMVTGLLGAAATETAALDLTRPSPLHSYFEGMRGRLPLETPATSDDPLALWINPAALGTGGTSGLGYLHSFSASSFSGDDAFAISLGSLAFGAEFMTLKETPLAEPRKETRRYTLASGQRLYKDIYFGTSYSWHASQISELDRASTWSAGVLVRPTRTISIAAVGRDLNSPTYYGNRFRPIIETSLGFRPVGEKLTLFVNYLARSRELEVRAPDGGTRLIETQPKSFFTFGVEAELLTGVSLRAGSDEDGNFSTSVSLLSGNAGVGSLFTTEKVDDGKDKRYGVVYATASPFWHESALTPRNGYLEIDLSGSIGETAPPFSIIGGGPRHTLKDLVDKLERAKHSPEIRGIVVKCTGVSANLAILDELRQSLIDFRASGKKAVAYLEQPTNREYYLATACDYIILIPNGYLGLVGLKAEGIFLRGTLEKLGIEAKYTKAGKYKSAVEALTEDQFTEPSREAENTLLDDIYAKFVGDIASGRGITEADARDLVDRGPFLPSDALKEGLIDTVAYWDQIPDIMSKVLVAGSRSIPYTAFARRNYAPTRWDQPPTIGIVYAVGSINHGVNRRDMLFGETMGSDTMTRAIKAMREDGSVKAVVVRVDSPGGVMSASDLIRHELELTRKEKPVIISMGGVAASGGYHIACDGTKILADEATITGSIGVFGLWLHTRGLYQKLGANKEIMTRGKHADAMPTWRDVTEGDLALVQAFVDEYYKRFVSDVAAGRSKTYEDIDSVAQGRVWSGKAGLAIGLVDRIGGLRAAIDLAKAEAGIAPDEQVIFRVLPKGGGLFESLISSAQARVAGQVQIPDRWRTLLENSALIPEFDEPFLYLAPFVLEIE